jgi:hypothetical protein
MKLTGRLVRVSDVTGEQRDAMFALMERYYDNVKRANFEADLDEKQWIIQVHDAQTGMLCGFSTQMLLDVEVQGRPIKALFSGDTIVARDYWGDNTLAQVGGRLALSLMDAFPEAELYWFLISKGYKTYRFLPVFFHEFYPRPETATPAWAKAILDALGRFKYPTSYDPGTGVVQASPATDRLRDGIADITLQRMRDPAVRFFVARNPGFARGDELCCVAALTRANFTPAAYRVLGQKPVSLGAFP